MKKFLLLAICALSVCLTGCSDNDTPEQLPDPELTLAPDAPIAFPAEGGSVEITVTTNMESWNAVSDQKWCKVAVSAGKFTVSAVENETPEAMPAATVTVTATSGERSVSRELQVSQEAGKEKYTDLSREGTSNCYLVTAAGNYSFDATVRGNGATTEGLDAPTAIAGTSAAVVWQSAPGLISGVTLADGRITMIPDSLVEDFLRNVLSRQVNPGVCAETPLKVVYTPLNGTGNKPVREVLRRIGVSSVTVVPEQEKPDGRFPTAPYPNPEIREAFGCALKLAEREEPDLLLATDPDCDRVGIAVRNGGDYTLMTGNEVGCLLLNYILSCRAAKGDLPEEPVVVKTIVTTDLATRIGEKYGCRMVEVLTGFKYIGEQIGLLEKAGHPERYIFGFEESYGYLSGTYVRDKDAVVASMLICEMAAYYRKQGKNLLQVLEELYAEYGVFRHSLLNAEFEGASGMAAMQRLMASLREKRPASIAGLRVVRFSDYQASEQTDLLTGETVKLDLPKSNVLSFGLEKGAGVIVRASGTEPKIKSYITATGADVAAADAMAAALRAAAEQLLKA